MNLMLHAKVEATPSTLCRHRPASRKFQRHPSRFDNGWSSFLAVFHGLTSPLWLCGIPFMFIYESAPAEILAQRSIVFYIRDVDM
jgi:hypothetical protein